MRRACEAALRSLDGERPLEDEILRHLEECPECSREFQARTRLTERLRQAVRNEPQSPYLEARIRHALRESHGRTAWNWGLRLIAVAAIVVACVATAIAYRSGHLRLTRSSQEAYIASISEKISGILQVGLGDHVHCAVFRKLPKAPPSAAEMIEQLGPGYGGLLSLVRARVPSEYRIIMAHRCSYHGRKFVHLAMQSDSRLISLVITRKGEGESFEKDSLRPVLSESGIPMYRGNVQRFAIGAFESRTHLAYLVSDLSQAENLQVLARLAMPVREFLNTVEG